MRISRTIGLSSVLAVASIAACTAQTQSGSYAITSATLKVNATTTIPGADLKPGAYTIRVIDNLKDRYILGVDDARNKEISTFIGLQQHGQMPGQSAPGPILWANAPGKTSALRGFAFANGLSFEFVYPKAKAVELAKLNTSSVAAIDPESEGMPVDPKLSPEDRKVVTLWMLTSTRVGTGKGLPAIEAKRYQARATTELAQNDPPLAPVAAQPSMPVVRPTTSPSPVAAQHSASYSAAAGKVKSRAVAAKLPQTASQLPLVLLVSICLLAFGFAVGLGRRTKLN